MLTPDNILVILDILGRSDVELSPEVISRTQKNCNFLIEEFLNTFNEGVEKSRAERFGIKTGLEVVKP